MQFRAEAFNVFKYVNFSSPNASVGSMGFGAVTSTSVAAQSLQLALKVLC